LTFSGTTITGNGASPSTSAAASFSGGDGGASGGVNNTSDYRGGAVGGNGTVASCGRITMTDISGLKAAVALAGGKTTEDCATSAAFGSGGSGKFDGYSPSKTPGYGGGGGRYTATGGSGAVVLYFT
jgi:hypothetical protein